MELQSTIRDTPLVGLRLAALAGMVTNSLLPTVFNRTIPGNGEQSVDLTFGTKPPVCLFMLHDEGETTDASCPERDDRTSKNMAIRLTLRIRLHPQSHGLVPGKIWRGFERLQKHCDCRADRGVRYIARCIRCLLFRRSSPKIESICISAERISAFALAQRPRPEPQEQRCEIGANVPTNLSRIRWQLDES